MERSGKTPGKRAAHLSLVRQVRLAPHGKQRGLRLRPAVHPAVLRAERQGPVKVRRVERAGS
jgi:hypothetical protein